MLSSVKSLSTALGLAAALTFAWAGPASAAKAPPPPSQNWSFEGVFGKFDRAAKQRGFQVYTEVCASCHGLRLMSFRNLSALGYTEDEIKAYAAQFEVQDGPDEFGEMFFRPAEPKDRFIEPFANAREAAAANGGAIPPDLTLMTKARKGGADYLYALLTGYRDEAPEGFELSDTQYYNDYYPGHAIAMAPPLWPDGVEYADGTPATVEQQARDLTTFLSWTAEPEMEERKSMGHAVILFILFFIVVAYFNKRRLWAQLH